jgi:hypothetical protein
MVLNETNFEYVERTVEEPTCPIRTENVLLITDRLLVKNTVLER